jgi:arylsulfatase A-like enzyme
MYYDEISRLDAQVGSILDELQTQGIVSNTLVLFISDNGRPFPRCKTTLYDSGIKTPLLARWPARIKPRTVCQSLISSIDLAPTFLALAGLEAPAGFQGHNAARLFTDPGTLVRAHIFAEHNWHDYDAHGRAIRDERFKYIRNFDREVANTPPADAVRSPTFGVMKEMRDARKLSRAQRAVFTRPKPAEELYDLNDDPHELRNLASERRYAGVLKSLRQRLNEWQEQTADPVPGLRAPDEFDRESGQPLENRRRPRISKRQLQDRE